MSGFSARARAKSVSSRRIGIGRVHSFFVLQEFAQGGAGAESADFDIGRAPAGEAGDFLDASFLEFEQGDDESFLGR